MLPILGAIAVVSSVATLVLAIVVVGLLRLNARPAGRVGVSGKRFLVRYTLTDDA